MKGAPLLILIKESIFWLRIKFRGHRDLSHYARDYLPYIRGSGLAGGWSPG